MRRSHLAPAARAAADVISGSEPEPPVGEGLVPVRVAPLATTGSCVTTAATSLTADPCRAFFNQRSPADRAARDVMAASTPSPEPAAAAAAAAAAGWLWTDATSWCETMSASARVRLPCRVRCSHCRDARRVASDTMGASLPEPPSDETASLSTDGERTVRTSWWDTTGDSGMDACPC